MIRIICVAMLLLLLSQACSESKFDYRHKYVGEYEVTGTEAWTGIGTPNDTFPVSTTCTVDFAAGRDSVRFTIEALTIMFDAKADRHGVLSVGLMGDFLGEFTDKDHFDMSMRSGRPVTGDDQFAYVLHGTRK